MSNITQPNLITKIRRFTRDKPELNRLINGYESLDTSIALAVENAVSRWNTTPPMGVSTMSVSVSGTTVVDGEDVELKVVRYPSDTEKWLLNAIAVELIDSVLFNKARNLLAYTDGGVSVREEEGAYKALSQIRERLTAEFDRGVIRYKTAKNYEQLLDAGGTVGSDYSYFYDWNVDSF